MGERGLGYIKKDRGVEMLKSRDVKVSGKLRIDEGVIRTIQEEARKKQPLETMGPLYGPFDYEPYEHEGKVFYITKAFGPGENSKHKLDACMMNDEYFSKLETEMWENGRNIVLGIWHSHPFQDIAFPSGADLVGHSGYPESSGWRGFNKKNNYGDMGHIQIIIAKRSIKAWHVTNNSITLIWECDDGIGWW